MEKTSSKLTALSYPTSIKQLRKRLLLNDLL